MKIGVELDMVFENCLEAFSLYEYVFDAEKIEASSGEKGTNEVVCKILGMQFHLLDENPEYSLLAPKKDDPKTMWCNLLVKDINAVYQKVEQTGFTIIQPLTAMPNNGVINAVVLDPFNYIWMLHQIVKEVSFEERSKIVEDNKR